MKKKITRAEENKIIKKNVKEFLSFFDNTEENIVSIVNSELILGKGIRRLTIECRIRVIRNVWEYEKYYYYINKSFIIEEYQLLYRQDLMYIFLMMITTYVAYESAENRKNAMKDNITSFFKLN